MTCKELVEFIGQYRAGELPGDVKERLDLHLGHCPDCGRYLRSYEATVRLSALAAGHPDDAPPPEVPEDLLQAIVAALGQAKEPSRGV